MSDARELWKRIETIHAVTYFASESIDAAKQAGLKGFWMGYFGFRAAPMGAVGVGPIHAAFANFAKPMVQRSIPDAWKHAPPAQLVQVRATAAAQALRRISPTLQDQAAAPSHALNLELGDLIADANADALGRPLFAANAELDHRPDSVEQLWQLCTTIREHRGDGHVIALASHQVDGCEAHRLHAAAHGTPHEVLRDNRGFSNDDWEAAGMRLQDRGLLEQNRLTPHGLDLVHSIEALTDELAMTPNEASRGASSLVGRLTQVASEITESGVLPFPNPMGLPKF